MTRRYFLKLLALALPALTVLSGLPALKKPFSALNRTFYVHFRGKDTHSGTNPDAPFQTLQHAVNSCKAGDTVMIFPGDYKVSEPVTIDKAGLHIIGIRGNKPVTIGFKEPNP